MQLPELDIADSAAAGDVDVGVGVEADAADVAAVALSGVRRGHRRRSRRRALPEVDGAARSRL